MTRFIAVVGVGALLFGIAALTASASNERAQAADRYIVVLKAGVDANAAAASHARAYGARPDFVYSHALNGYAAVIPNERVAAVRIDLDVAYVEPDGEVTVDAQVLPWGIDRVDADQSSTAAGDGTGEVANVNVYVIDTGIDTAHPDLRVVQHVNFAGGKNQDCHGHGTHVAGTISARDNALDVVGVGPGAPLTGVKVLKCNGSGSNSGVIAGVDWVTANAVKPAVANMSLGGGVSTALDDAVRRSAGSGVVYAVAAGNSGANACNYSPARAGAGTNNGIVTVAATDSADREASWSNFGSCVDIWAPGVSILSTRRGGGTTTMSGTSMASPHVAGIGALYLVSSPGANASTVEASLKGSAVSPGTTSKNGVSIKLAHAGGY